MSTIKEVAKLANVSIGTVSNVLNGKTDNEQLINRVEKAMEELSYLPNTNARSLKNTKSSLIGVIVPNILQKEYSEFVKEVEEGLKAKGYSILLMFSQNNRMIEKKNILRCVEHCVDGVILYSITRKTPIFVLEKKQIPSVLITRRNNCDFSGDRIVIDYSDAFERALQSLHERCKEHIGLIMEYDLMDDETLRNIYKKYCFREDLIKIVDCSKERGFQAFFELYLSHPETKCVIAGSYLIAQGIKKAMDTLGVTDVSIIVIKESSWIEDEGDFEGQVSIFPKRIASQAINRLMEAIENPSIHEPITSVVSAEYDKISSIKNGIKAMNKQLRFAMFDCPSSWSLKMLTTVYEKESGGKIAFDLFSYSDLERILYKNAADKSGHYDGFMMDITWLEGLIESGCVLNLDHLRMTNQKYFNGFIDGILENYGMYVESLYAFPFMSGAQILFYQKDLFEEPSIKRRFKRLYGEELTPPSTWAQFNIIAEFFTKSIHPFSPVNYGAALVGGVNVFTTISFLNRLWSYGSSIFNEKGNVIINSSNAEVALKNFVNSYKYTSPEVAESWNEVLEEFKSGEYAMTLLYDSDSCDINNYTKSKIAGNIGYSLLPGGTPVLGGWSLGINRYGRNIQQTEEFLMWACGDQNAIPLALLGGSTLRSEYYERSDLQNLEPWKSIILRSYAQSRKRYMPEILDESRWKNNIYTSIIPEELVRVLSGEVSEKEALINMELKLKQLIGE